MTAADVAAFDRELEELLVCPDCRGPAAVASRIVGQIRNIRILTWHERSCPNKRGQLRWTADMRPHTD